MIGLVYAYPLGIDVKYKRFHFRLRSFLSYGTEKNKSWHHLKRYLLLYARYWGFRGLEVVECLRE